MSKVLNCLGALALISTLAACNQSEAPTENAAMNDMNAMSPDASNPFAESEMKMDQAMTAAVGSNAADNWVRKMIEHHRGAVDMSRIALAGGMTGDAAKMAQLTIDKQGKEITALEKLVATGAPDPASAELYKPASMTMHTGMMAAKGSDLTETYLRKMLAHHQGAVAMSDVALANGTTGAVRTQIEKTKAGQQREIAHVEAMLRGDPMAAAPSAPAAQPTATAAAKPAEPRAAVPRPAPAKPTPAKPKPADPAPDPHAGHDMNNM